METWKKKFKKLQSKDKQSSNSDISNYDLELGMDNDKEKLAQKLEENLDLVIENDY